jgi:hypothetical protein
MRSPPAPPRPDLVRQAVSGFGWLDNRLLRDGWLQRLGPDGVAVLAFLVIAADRCGVSYYSRSRIAVELDLDVARVDRALDALLEAELIAHRPWRKSRRDGVWQVLPVPAPTPVSRSASARSARSILHELGFGADQQNRGR